MSTLRTELLIPRAVDLNDEPESTVSGRRADKRKIMTVASLRAALAQMKVDLAKIDYSSTRRRLVELSSVPEDEIEDAELEVASRLAYELQFAEETVQAFNDDYFTLLAVEESLGHPVTARLRDAHPSLDWLLKAEVGVRQAWIDHHHDLLRAEREVKEPYRCRVGDWLSPERKHDREYYVLIRYLHGLRACCGEEWVLSERGETPDFVLKRGETELLGAEMSEVPISQEWADAQRLAARVKPVLFEILRLHRKNLQLHDPDWAKLYDNLGDVKAVVSKAAASGSVSIENSAIPLNARLRPSEGEPHIFLDSCRGEIDQDIRERESQLANAIREAAGKKLIKRNGQPRKSPALRPCDLVLYPNGSFFLELDRVARIVAERLELDHTTHFDRIWLISEERIAQIA